MVPLLSRLERTLDRLEAFLAVAGLILMLVLSLVQIGARNFFDTGFPLADELLRYLVLLVSFLGAVLAVREQRHIKIDIALSWMAPAWRHLVEVLFNFLSSVVCILFAWAAARFWAVEWQTAPAPDKWIAGLVLVLPVSFALLALHFLLRIFLPVTGPGAR